MRRALALLAPVLLAAGCVTETPEEPVRRSFTWVSDSTTTRYTEKDARNALVLPVGIEVPEETFVTDALSLTFYPGEEARRNGDRLYHGLTIAICRGLGDAGGAAGPRILERPDRDVVLLEQGSATALQVQEVVERGRPWGYVGTGRHFADYYEMTGCMNGRRWSGTGTYPDEFLRELLLRLRRAIPFPSAIPDRSPATARD